LTGDDLVDATRYLLLTGGDTDGDLVDATRYLLLHLLLTGGNPVDALSHRVEIKRHCADLLLIQRGRGWRGECDHVGSALRNRFGLRCQPAKERVRVCDHLSRRVAIRLPSQGGSYTDAKDDQETGEGARSPFAE
jgi:hypothetical protein